MIKLHDRIKELSYVVGTGNITLSGAVRGFSTFSSCYSNNDILFYTISDGTNYELGSGLYISGSNSINRFPVKSTNSNNRVDFAIGTKEVYVNYPATNSVFNTSGINPVPQNSGLAFWTSSNSLSYSDKFVIDSGKGRFGINNKSPSYAIDLGDLSANSIIRSSGFIIGNSGIIFPSGNDGTSAYSGGVQFVHFEKNQLSSALSTILQLSGIVNQNILLKKQNVNTVLAGPSGACDPPCDPDYPVFRYLAKGDLPEEISNWTIGDEDSSTFLTINLPQGLPDIVYRDINAISVNTDNGIFAVNGLGQIKFATIDYSQVENLPAILSSVQSTLNTKITSVSGILNDRITNLSNSVLSGKFRCDGRLSTNSSNATADGNSDSIYFVPYNGNFISLYDGTSWQTISFSSTLVKTVSTLFAPGTSVDPAGKVFDIFAYLSGGNLAFDVQVWTDINNRSVALGTRDGVYVKSTDHTRRYIGSVMPISYGGYPPTGGNKFTDINNYRYIFNYYNRVTKISNYRLSRTWTCNSISWRQLLNTYIGLLNSITVNVLCGIQDDMISVEVGVKCTSPLISNSNYMLTINSSNFDLNSIESLVYVPPTQTKHFIDTMSADYNDNIEKQLLGSMTQVVPIGINTYYVAEKVLSGKNTPNLTFDYTNGISAMWRC